MISVQMSHFLLRPLQFPFCARKTSFSFRTAAFIALAVSLTVATQTWMLHQGLGNRQRTSSVRSRSRQRPFAHLCVQWTLQLQ